MARIVEGETPIVLIDTFRVKPEKAEALIEMLGRATDQVMRHQAGFVSASIHRGSGKEGAGDRITNYAQWRNREDLEAMQAHPEARKRMKACAGLAEDCDPQIYSVVSVREPVGPDRLSERRDGFFASLRNLS